MGLGTKNEAYNPRIAQRILDNGARWTKISVLFCFVLFLVYQTLASPDPKIVYVKLDTDFTLKTPAEVDSWQTRCSNLSTVCAHLSACEFCM